MTRLRLYVRWFVRDLRAYPCWLIAVKAPHWHGLRYGWRWRLWLALLPYAGDWIYREERHAFERERAGL